VKCCHRKANVLRFWFTIWSLYVLRPYFQIAVTFKRMIGRVPSWSHSLCLIKFFPDLTILFKFHSQGASQQQFRDSVRFFIVAMLELIVIHSIGSNDALWAAIFDPGMVAQVVKWWAWQSSETLSKLIPFWHILHQCVLCRISISWQEW
jgi:hypothetical protein